MASRKPSAIRQSVDGLRVGGRYESKEIDSVMAYALLKLADDMRLPRSMYYLGFYRCDLPNYQEAVRTRCMS